jgi:riboflavin kinase/FMN adenylyltransferase
MRELADAHGRQAVVVTFFPPAKVLFAGANYLNSREEKLRLLEAVSPDLVVMIPFDRAFATTDADLFVAQLAAMRPTAFVVGADFRFGQGRRGGVADLAAVAPIEDVEEVTVDGERVASTLVRELLAAGDVEGANRLLGAPYPATGRVARGDQRGRTIGYPTANLALDPAKALPLGVFAVTVETDAGAFGGMANVGPRPSFPDDPPSLEVNLFDFVGDLYDQTITVRFHRRLRGQRRFASLDELKAQLAADERAARAALATL